MKLAPIILTFALAGCGGSSSSPPAPPSLPPSPPSATPWAVTAGSAPGPLGFNGASYLDVPPACAPTPQDKLPCYVSNVEQPYGPIAGRLAVTLSYSITGTAPVFTNLSNGNTCGGPPSISLLLHQAGDNMSGQGAYAFFRWYSMPEEQPLELGDHVLTVPLTVDKWIPVYASTPDANAAGFATALANLGKIGFGFGGGCFATHGVAVTSGSARLTITGFSAQ